MLVVVTYRDADPDGQAAAERQIAADEALEVEASAGRAEGAKRERMSLLPAPAKRLDGVTLATMVGGSVGAVIAAIASGPALPIALGAAMLGGAATWIGKKANARRRTRATEAWLAKLGFPLRGFLDVADASGPTTLQVVIELAESEPADRTLVLDLMGHVMAVPPDVTVEGCTITIKTIVLAHVGTVMRSIVEHVVCPLHASRGVVDVKICKAQRS